jgi:hypothetical protein
MLASLVIKTVIWLAIMAAVLFVPAGTIWWPQAWVFLIVLGGSGVLVSAWLYRPGAGARSRGRVRDSRRLGGAHARGAIPRLRRLRGTGALPARSADLVALPFRAAAHVVSCSRAAAGHAEIPGGEPAARMPSAGITLKARSFSGADDICWSRQCSARRPRARSSPMRTQSR